MRSYIVKENHIGSVVQTDRDPGENESGENLFIIKGKLFFQKRPNFCIFSTEL